MRDTAVSLANTSRYNGYTEGYYSVAQHATIMSYWAEGLYEGSNQDIARAALLHDAAEAWIGEMVKPLRAVITALDAIEDRIARMYFERHDLDPDLWCCEEIAELDQIMAATEVRDLKPGMLFDEKLAIPSTMVSIYPQQPRAAFENFKLRYNTLFPDRRMVGAYTITG